VSESVAPSAAFLRVLRELRATGREKLDGFAAEELVGLAGAERSEVRRLLMDAIGHGDDTAAAGLVMLDGPAAVPALQAALDTAFRAPLTPRARVLGLLWRQTGDARYSEGLAGMAADGRGFDSLDRQVALVQLENTRSNRPVVRALWAVLQDPDANAVLRSIAARQLLYTAGRMADVNDMEFAERGLVVRLKHASGVEHMQALGDLERALQGTPAARE
jgi:hypothetical protein